MVQHNRAFRSIRKTWEYQRVKEVGCKLNTPHFVLLFADNSLNVSRLGITVSRKVGNAVERNKVKRYIREYFRNNRLFLRQSCDYSVIAKRGAAQLSSSEIYKQLDTVFLRTVNKND